MRIRKEKVNNWMITTLGDCVSLLGDGLHGTPIYSEDGDYYFINGNNLSEGKIVIKEDTKRVSESEYKKYKKNLNDRTILVSINGTLGNVGTYNNEKVILGKSACYFNVKPNIDKNFIKYTVSTNTFKYYSETFATGATIKNLSLAQIKKYKFQLPPLPTQQKIASILSAYDKLIQNYKKQIEALQTAAGELYKEWFVRFRFPDYQTTKFENGIPEGWSIEKLTELIEIKYGKDHSKLDDGNIPVYGSGGIMRYCNKALYDKETVLIPRKGSLNNIMYANGPLWTVDTMFYSIMLRKNIAKYLYYVLSKIDMESFNAGAALPSMTTEILSHFKIIVPDNIILESFDNKIALIFTQIDNLQQQITNLTQQRDLLLPRLMSGKLEVE